MKNTTQTAAIAEGAMMAAITAILGLTGIYFPFIKIFTDMIWTVPIIVLIIRHGISIGVLAMTVAGILIFSMSNPIKALILVIQFGALSIFYGYSFKKKSSPGIVIFIGTGVALASGLLSIFLMITFFGPEQFDVVRLMKDSVEPMMELYKNGGLFSNPARTGITEEMVRQIVEYSVKIMSLLIPAFIIVWGYSVAFINYMVSDKILNKLRISTHPIAPFREWELPWWIVYGFIIGFGAYLIGKEREVTQLVTVGLNIMMVYVPVLFISGLSVVVFYMKKYFASRTFKIITFIFCLLFFQTIIFAIASVGFFDLLINFRKLPRGG